MKAVNLLLPLLLLPVLSAARGQSPLPDAVERVIAEAEARADPQQRWAFTRTYTRNGETLLARYDPRRPAQEAWRLTTPSSEDALTKNQREMFRDMQAESGVMADRAVMIRPSEGSDDGLRYLLGDSTLIEDGPSGKRYAFRWPEVLPAGGRRTQMVDEAR